MFSIMMEFVCFAASPNELNLERDFCFVVLVLPLVLVYNFYCKEIFLMVDSPLLNRFLWDLQVNTEAALLNWAALGLLTSFCCASFYLLGYLVNIISLPFLIVCDKGSVFTSGLPLITLRLAFRCVLVTGRARSFTWARFNRVVCFCCWFWFVLKKLGCWPSL